MYEVQKIKLQYIPFKCPNCNGYGSVSYGKQQCKVCKGKGLVVINQEDGLIVDDDDKHGQSRLDKTT